MLAADEGFKHESDIVLVLEEFEEELKESKVWVSFNTLMKYVLSLGIRIIQSGKEKRWNVESNVFT
jgi:hypothetical protein